MHEEVALNCLFGCNEEPDDLSHYLKCAPLWCIVGEALGSPPPFGIDERLGVKKPSVFSVSCLAVAFHGYHYSKSSFTHPQPPLLVQTACLGACKAFKIKIGLES
jgi:hypothetical protein